MSSSMSAALLSAALLASSTTTTASASASASSLDARRVGLGLSRLQQRGSGSGSGLVVGGGGLGGSVSAGEATECEHVQEFRFTQAVLDNFSPINEQQLWEGEGQRYWLNKGE
jgi:mevalonate pyrophosphate decarboxylase